MNEQTFFSIVGTVFLVLFLLAIIGQFISQKEYNNYCQERGFDGADGFLSSWHCFKYVPDEYGIGKKLVETGIIDLG